MCPVHGEFTIAPLVVQDPHEGWLIHFHDETEASMWANCRAIDGQ